MPSRSPEYWIWELAQYYDFRIRNIRDWSSKFELPLDGGPNITRFDFVQYHKGLYGNGGMDLDVQNWSDRITSDRLGFREVYSNDFYISHHYLPGFFQVDLFENGRAIYERVKKAFGLVDEHLREVRRGEYYYRTVQEKINGGGGYTWDRYATDYSSRAGDALRTAIRITEKILNNSSQAKALEDLGNRLTLRDLEATRSAITEKIDPGYSRMHADRGALDDPRVKQLEENFQSAVLTLRTRPGFVSNQELFGYIVKGLSIANDYQKIFFGATLAVGAVVTGGALATTLAPTVGGAIGISTGTASAAIQGGTVAAVTGGDALKILSPVAGEVGKNIGGPNVGFLDGITSGTSDFVKSIGGTSIGGIVDTISGIKPPTVENVQKNIGDALRKLTPDQIIGAVKPSPVPVPVAGPSPIPEVVKQAALPMGAVLVLAAILFLNRKG